MVSVVKTVVGARLEALDLFFGLRTILLGAWSLVPETELLLLLPLSGFCKEGKVALLCAAWLWLLGSNCWDVGDGDDEAMNAPRSLQFGSDLRFFDQTPSRLRSEFGFVDLDNG